MNERNKGRFGVKTNQTLKYSRNLNFEKEKGCIFEWHDVSGPYERQHVISHSIDKHRRWELAEDVSSEQQQQQQSSQFEEKQERKEKNKDDKKEDFQRKTDKSKHSKRLERKEQNKKAALLEKQKELQANETATQPKYQDDGEKEKVVKIYTSGTQIRDNLNADKAPDLNIYVPEDEGVRMKKGQSRHREKYVYSGDIEPRREKKEQFVKSIFL